MFQWDSFGALVFWHARNLDSIWARVFAWLHYFFLNAPLRVRTIYVFSARFWTYWKMLRVSWLVLLKYWSGWVGLMVVWCHLVDTRTALLLIMLKYRSLSTVSCANTFSKFIINNKWFNSLTYTIEVDLIDIFIRARKFFIVYNY